VQADRHVQLKCPPFPFESPAVRPLPTQNALPNPDEPCILRGPLASQLPMTPLRSLSVAATLLSVLATSAAAQSDSDHAEARSLFLANCASCHGESGDGEGTTQLDRKARSFKDGGFSFGNTPEALARTLTTGIPGTPMPSFESALSEEQRRLLAEYVVTLGPPATEVDLSRTEVTVLERPVFVRGMLPPMLTTAQAVPRGLVFGLPSRQSFEYRTDDVRLLGTRYGGFVRRADWTGRGGAGLEPLGKLVSTIEGGAPRSTFLLPGTKEEPLRARFRGSWIEGSNAGIRYEVLDAKGGVIAQVRESLLTRNTSAGLGYTRRFELTGTGLRDSISLRTPSVSGEQNSPKPIYVKQPGPANTTRTWSVTPLSKSVFDCNVGPWRNASESIQAAPETSAPIHLRKDEVVVVETTYLSLNQFTSETLKKLQKEFAQ